MPQACRWVSRGAIRWAMSLALLSALSLTGCTDYSKLLYTKDDRLDFTAPANRELVKTPLSVSWTIDDFTVVKPGIAAPADDAGYFAVFVDRAPIEPGHTLDDVADDDEACERDPKCPDRQYLSDRGVYTTSKTSLVLEQILPLDNEEDIHLHEVTVVLLDSSGRRIGESAWYRYFKMENGSSE